ncbi:MAG: methyltransferase [Anaerolineae bacterium]|nr:methyltransferase [Anaerolineae bacterium]
MENTPTLLALCIRQDGNELVAAECQNLTGGAPAPDGVAACCTLDHIASAAYVKTGLRLIARGPTLPDLVEAVRCADFDADRFRIEVQRLTDRFGVHKRECMVALANAIGANPNLDAPRHRFLALLREDGFYFGEILVESGSSYLRHDEKPCRTSTSLPSRVARAMVNLVAPPARSILNLCCGSGSILLEACALGLDVRGIDWNWKMVEMSRNNLAHFGYAATVERGDAREATQIADAVVTDLPYGRYLVLDEETVKGILARAALLAPVGVFAAGSDITPWLQEAGYTGVEVYRIRKHAGFIRYIHRARSCRTSR